MRRAGASTQRMADVASRYRANKQKRTRSGNGIAIGLILAVGAAVLRHDDRTGPITIYGLIMLVGLLIYISSAIVYVKSKGYPGMMGLITLTGPHGILIILRLDDKKRFHDREGWSTDSAGDAQGAWTMAESARLGDSVSSTRGEGTRGREPL